MTVADLIPLPPLAKDVALVVGLLVAVVKILGVLKAFLRQFVLGGVNTLKHGKWAVVTGATDGIGRAYADALAKRGHNLVLISRTQSKLETAAQEIMSANANAEVQTVAVDFSEGAEGGIYDVIGEALEGLEIGVLVNNVGMSYDHPEYFDQIDESILRDMIRLNIDSVNYMTRLVIGGMLERKKGVVLSVSSFAGVLPSALLAVYSGSKAYVDFFMRSLSYEYRTKGLVFEAHTPALVPTKLSKVRATGFTQPSPKNYVAASLGRLGQGPSISPSLGHNLQQHVLKDVLPESFAAGKIGDMHRGVRKRALKRKAEKASKGE